MITFKIKGNDPNEIREQAKLIFGLAEPQLQQQAADLATAVTEANEIITVHEELPPAEEKPKKTRGKKTAPEPEAPKGDDLEPPAFLDRRPEAKAPVEDAAKLLEQLRATASKLLEAGTSMADITKVVQTFLMADGKTKAVKMSQIAPAELPKAIAAFEALLPGAK